MILYLKDNRQIYGYNTTLSIEQEDIEIKKKNAIKYTGDFSWNTGEDKNGYIKYFYLNDDNSIRIVYAPIPEQEPPLSETDKKLLQIQATVDYLAMMTE